MNQVRENLVQRGFCWRCVKRFTPEARNHEVHQIDANVNASKEESLHCGSCLGILHDESVENSLKMITDSIGERNYESENFNLAISVPQALLLRQKSSMIFIKKLQEENNVAPIPTIGPWLVKDVLKQSLTDLVEQATNKKCSNKSELLVNVIYKYKKDDHEISSLESLLPNQRKDNNKRKFHQRHKKNHHDKPHPLNSIDNVNNVIRNLSDIEFSKYTAIPPQKITEPCTISVDVCQGSIFFGGRYNKYSRTLSQTPWIIEGTRKSETSVQELVCEKIIQAVDCKEAKFLSAGREDVDVKMLGKGRPFALELVDPRRIHITQNEVSHLQIDINKSTELIAIRDLQIINRDGLKELKKGEESKTKSYSAKLWCPVEITNEKLEELNLMKNIIIAQKTPLRVLHRRPIMTREKTVHDLTITRIDDIHYHLHLLTEAGTYIKEFVHSDFGRTVPSLQSLLQVPIDIIELDVDAVGLDWPPPVDIQ